MTETATGPTVSDTLTVIEGFCRDADLSCDHLATSRTSLRILHLFPAARDGRMGRPLI